MGLSLKNSHALNTEAWMYVERLVIANCANFPHVRSIDSTKN